MSEKLDFNRPAFHAAARWLREQGHEVVSPAEIEAEGWRDAMIKDIKLLVDCDAIFMLPGWRMSRGATLEVHIARELGMAIEGTPND